MVRFVFFGGFTLLSSSGCRVNVFLLPSWLLDFSTKQGVLLHIFSKLDSYSSDNIFKSLKCWSISSNFFSSQNKFILDSFNLQIFSGSIKTLSKCIKNPVPRLLFLGAGLITFLRLS